LPIHSLGHDVLTAAIRQLQRIDFYQFSTQLMKLEPGIGSEARLARDGTNAGDVLRRVDKKDRAWIVQNLAAAVSGIRNVEAVARAGRRVIVFSQSNESGRSHFDASMMSDGTLRSLGILLALRQFPTPSAVLIDEIEDSLHPFAQSVLLDAIEEASVEFPIVVSTHNPEILSHPSARPERIRVIQWEEGSSKVYHLSETIQNELKPPETVGRLLRSNALWTEDEPSTCGSDDDFFKL
jgi:predicted ATPase